MTDTNDKLNEAKYFLERMKEDRFNRDHFRWNLSGFLSAARSTTMIMNIEFSKFHNYEGWLPGKIDKANRRSKGLMKYFHEQRRLTVHVRQVKPSGHFSIACKQTMHVGGGFVISGTGSTVTISDPESGASNESLEDKPVKDCCWYFDDLSDKDVVGLCQDYVDELEMLVSECESKFL